MDKETLLRIAEEHAPDKWSGVQKHDLVRAVGHVFNMNSPHHQDLTEDGVGIINLQTLWVLRQMFPQFVSAVWGPKTRAFQYVRGVLTVRTVDEGYSYTDRWPTPTELGALDDDEDFDLQFEVERISDLLLRARQHSVLTAQYMENVGEGEPRPFRLIDDILHSAVTALGIWGSPDER